MLSLKPLGCWNWVGTVGKPAAVMTESKFELPASVWRMASPRNSAGVVRFVRKTPPVTLTKKLGVTIQSTLPE